MMIARFSVLAVCGILLTILGVSQSANLRAPKEVESEVAEEAALMLAEEEEALMRALIEEDGHEEFERLLKDWNNFAPMACPESDPGMPYPYNQNPDIWGTCATMHPCLCGMDPVKFALGCPSRCRKNCGGTCAEKWSNCPDGYQFDKDGVPRNDFQPVTYDLWPSNLGEHCSYRG